MPLPSFAEPTALRIDPALDIDHFNDKIAEWQGQLPFLRLPSPLASRAHAGWWNVTPVWQHGPDLATGRSYAQIALSLGRAQHEEDAMAAALMFSMMHICRTPKISGIEIGFMETLVSTALKGCGDE